MTCHEPENEFVTYEQADGELVYGEFSWVTDLTFFDDRCEEIVLIKKTYHLVDVTTITLADPYPIEEDDDELPDQDHP